MEDADDLGKGLELNEVKLLPKFDIPQELGVSVDSFYGILEGHQRFKPLPPVELRTESSISSPSMNREETQEGYHPMLYVVL